MRPPGENREPSRTLKKRFSQVAALFGSIAASACAMRRRLPATVRSSQSRARQRYFVSRMWRENLGGKFVHRSTCCAITHQAKTS
jgi:hypothetical protein